LFFESAVCGRAVDPKNKIVVRREARILRFFMIAA